MLKIVGKNDLLQTLVRLFSDDFVDGFISFVDNNRVAKSHRFPSPKNVQDFIFWYDFIEERELIVIKAFKLKQFDEIYHGEEKDSFLIRKIYNEYLDKNLYIE